MPKRLRAYWHPHLHLLVTDGGFRRAVLRLFVRLELSDEDHAADMLTWSHSGFHVHTAVWEGHVGSRRTIRSSSWLGCWLISPTKGTSRHGTTGGMPTVPAACGARRHPPPQTGRWRSRPR